jgi:hypothetical protein
MERETKVEKKMNRKLEAIMLQEFCSSNTITSVKIEATESVAFSQFSSSSRSQYIENCDFDELEKNVDLWEENSPENRYFFNSCEKRRVEKIKLLENSVIDAIFFESINVMNFSNVDLNYFNIVLEIAGIQDSDFSTDLVEKKIYFTGVKSENTSKINFFQKRR